MEKNLLFKRYLQVALCAKAKDVHLLQIEILTECLTKLCGKK